MTVSAPQLLNGTHETAQFRCGKASLDEWLTGHAFSNQAKGFSRVLVVCEGNRVIAFYSLAPTTVTRQAVPRTIRTGRAPDPVPCILLGQFAVDLEYRGRGVGSALLRDAFERTRAGAEAIGGRALIVRAIDGDAEAYWRSNGFTPAPDDPSILFRGIDAIGSDLAGIG